LASNRISRPNDYNLAPPKCPFCPGNERETPPAILEIRKNGKWHIRVVPNKFPALLTGEKKPVLKRDGIHLKMPGKGVHEVVIETPKHDAQMYDMTDGEIHEVFKVYQERAKAISSKSHIKYLMIFKNRGRHAGASLVHPHSQIIGMPMLPVRVVNELNGAREYYDAHLSCAFCDIVREESGRQKRVIAENKHFIAIEPYAARFSFETWILPKRHEGRFEFFPETKIKYIAPVLKEALRKLDYSLNKADFNLLFHTLPPGEKREDFFHWHIEIMPKISYMAGFEWGTGFYINTVSPEKAAWILNNGSRAPGI